MTTQAPFNTNDDVITPNGAGVVQGRMLEDNVLLIIVRHQLDKMTNRNAGHCITPNAKISGLWAYECKDVQKNNAPTGRNRREK